MSPSMLLLIWWPPSPNCVSLGSDKTCCLIENIQNFERSNCLHMDHIVRFSWVCKCKYLKICDFIQAIYKWWLQFCRKKICNLLVYCLCCNCLTLHYWLIDWSNRVLCCTGNISAIWRQYSTLTNKVNILLHLEH